MSLRLGQLIELAFGRGHLPSEQELCVFQLDEDNLEEIKQRLLTRIRNKYHD